MDIRNNFVSYDLVLLAILIVFFIVAVWAIILNRTTRYAIYERRIDVARGVFRRRHESIWLYEITDTRLEQPLYLTLLGTARIKLITERGRFFITGLSSGSSMKKLWEELRDSIVAQRYALKGLWV